jgi:hypothetical protein
MNKTTSLSLLLGLFLFLNLAGTPAFGDEPPLTGITIDEELAQLLKQVVPYNPPEKDALPVEQRFLFNLNKLINEDLKEQNEKYKLATAKLALRMALAMNKTVDSIEVRPNHTDFSTNSYWALGCYSEDRTQWGGCYDLTVKLFSWGNGRIINKIDVVATSSFCDGPFGSCCGGHGGYPPGIDDAWFRHFVDLGREADFPERFRVKVQER